MEECVGCRVGEAEECQQDDATPADFLELCVPAHRVAVTNVVSGDVPVPKEHQPYPGKNGEA